MKTQTLADILAECLDSIEQGRRTPEECLALYPDFHEEIQPLLGTVQRLAGHSAYTARPGFQQASRQRLLLRIRSAPRQSRQPVQTWLPSLLTFKKTALTVVALLAFFISMLGSSTVYAAASQSVPGDTLYPMKRSLESMRLFLADDQEDVRLATEFLSDRVEEISRLHARNQEDDLALAADSYSETILLAEESLAKVALQDPETAAQLAAGLEQALSVHTRTLTSLLEAAPAQAWPALERAIQSSAQGQSAINNALPSGQATPPKDEDPGGPPAGHGPPDGIPGPGNPHQPGGGPPEGGPGPGNSPGGGNPPAGVPTGIPNAPGNRP